MNTATVSSTTPQTAAAEARLRRIRTLAWLLDESIVLPGGYRIGLDALIGLAPGLGDVIGAAFSAYLIYEARALGASRSVLTRMAVNVLIETAIGALPFVGDLFDAAFKANSRNLALLEQGRRDPIRARRSSRMFIVGFSLLVAALVIAALAIPALLIVWLVRAL